MTASGSSSSGASRAELPTVELAASGALPPLVAAFLEGRDLDLLAPVRFLSAGESPVSPPLARRDRGELAEALASANRSYGHPGADEQARLLEDSATRVVMTGQQPGLLGGPLYTLSKAVAAALWAERLRQSGESAVAVFWMATEDHDFRESSRATFLTPQGPLQVDLGEDREPLVPVGARRIGDTVGAVLTRLHEAIPGERFGTWIGQLRGWYRPEAHFGEAFAALMTHLMGGRCPLLVDAMLPALKAAQKPWLRRIVDERHALAQLYGGIDERIADRRYPLQVRPQPGASPLFLLHRGQRRRIEWGPGERLHLRGEEGFEEKVDWLLEIIEQQPERVSPGVRARMAVQDAVFGTDLEILGPGELSYLPQVAPLFALLEIPPPTAVLRPQVLILEEHHLGKLAESRLALAEILDPGLDLDARLARPQDLAFIARAEESLENLLLKMKESALDLDANLERPWSKTGDQMHRALEAFQAKVQAAAARRDEISRQRAEDLRAACLPLGRPQERVVATAQFPGKYGKRFVDAMCEQMALESTNLQIIVP